MLIVFSGLPGTGKTTLAHALAQRIAAVYLRIDTIEQAIRNAGVLAGDIGASGYQVANPLALANLRLGHAVVADCVNPVAESRQAWAATARSAGVALLDIQVICSDTQEHRRRVESRRSDIAGLVPPSWASVLAHDFEVWAPQPFTLDTCAVSIQVAVETVVALVNRRECG